MSRFNVGRKANEMLFTNLIFNAANSGRGGSFITLGGHIVAAVKVCFGVILAMRDAPKTC